MKNIVCAPLANRITNNVNKLQIVIKENSIRIQSKKTVLGLETYSILNK